MREKIFDLGLDEALRELKSARNGLSEQEARKRARENRPFLLKPKKKVRPLLLFIRQFTSPLVLLLLFAALFSFGLHDKVDGRTITTILLLSGFLGFIQEKGALDTIDHLLKSVETTSLVLRDGNEVKRRIEQITLGDVVLLRAGDIVPADAIVIEQKDLYVDQASLTGESFAVEKNHEKISPGSPILKKENIVFKGTHVLSGTASVLVYAIGKNTEFGKIAEHLEKKAPKTAYEEDLKVFGYFLMAMTGAFVLSIFSLNILFHRPVLESLFFALALSIGFTPQLLPMIITVNLAKGAKYMAKRKVIVKKLSSIENFGSMQILCTDKTGTLTTSIMELTNTVDPQGNASSEVELFAYLNAFFQSGYLNPIDQAITLKKPDITSWKKLDEIPYDFVRKRLSILVEKEGKKLLITKGALDSIGGICNELPNQDLFIHWSTEGNRVLGIAIKEIDKETINHNDETQMRFAGFLLFRDPPKKDVSKTLEHLKNIGITLKMVTGDNRFVAQHIAKEVGIEAAKVIIGEDIKTLTEEQLQEAALACHVFAEIEPIQKEKIITALKKSGNIVGYMGDGLNDATAFHAADVGISVSSAVPFLKERADIVLLDKNLSILMEGVKEGRRTFANILKYIFMATSANFGNMFSMAIASLMLPFLPLLPRQILLNNLITDLPEMTIVTDNVDSEMLAKPWRWKIGFIQKFMVFFGLISSLFDFTLFGVLLFILKATPDLFRSAWFVESVMSASLIILFIRTRKPFYKSMPSPYLTASVVLVNIAAILLPFTFLGPVFRLTILPGLYYAFIAAILVAYMIFIEVGKIVFYKLYDRYTKRDSKIGLL